MEIEPQEASFAVILRAIQLLDRYGKAAEEPSGVLTEREAKRAEWRGFKIKFRSPGERNQDLGALRIRFNDELMLYAKLDRGWRDDTDRISDLRARPGLWREEFLALR
jgi:hypothetical protein